ITLRHLLTMTSGSPVTGFADDEREDPDLAGRFLRTDLVAEPGARYEYSNGSTFLVGRAIAARTGLSLRDYLMPRL
ncbi:serine hydrolase domain-containing protein, partial [Pseudomonas sp. PNPG3]|uniref:serine hydrolase n=1 Tax=Pseudomonas sp. PNPG3 TaxID=2919497 RepID=UPI001FFCE0AD